MTAAPGPQQPDEVRCVTHTFVPTVSTIHPANPYLVCRQCRQPVHHFSNTGEGDGPVRNQPCDHAADYDDTCPSWGPVDGCRCAEQLAYVPHPAQPVRDTEEGRR